MEQTNWSTAEDELATQAKKLIAALVKKLLSEEEEPLKNVLMSYYGELIGQKRPVSTILSEMNQMMAMKIVDCQLVFSDDVAVDVKKLMMVATLTDEKNTK